MRKTIVRTIAMTAIESANIIFEKGKPVAKANAGIIENGIVTEDKAIKIVRKAYGDSAQVVSVKTVDNTYEISVEDFIKYAKKVETPAATEGTENNGDKQ